MHLILLRMVGIKSIKRLNKGHAYPFFDKMCFPHLPVSILFHRVVGLDSSLDTASNMEDGRHDRSRRDGVWKMIVACVKRKVELVYVLLTIPQAALKGISNLTQQCENPGKKKSFKDHIAAILSPISI